MNDREFLHHLVDRLPPEALDDARQALGQLTDDPLLRVLATAPLDDEPLDSAELARITSGNQGETYTHEQVRQMLNNAASRLVS